MIKSPGQNYFFSDKTINRLQFFCLYTSCAMFFLLLVLNSENQLLTIAYRMGILGSSILFSAVSWIAFRRSHSRYPVMLSAIMAAWLLLTQLIHIANGTIVHYYTQYLPVYLLAFPFAAITHDGDRQKGLKTISAVYLSAFLLWVLYTILLLLGRVPSFLRPLVRWDGPRLTILTQANVCARGFMIGIALSLGYSFKTSRIWAKILLWIAAVLMFVCLALTNSRSAILVTGFLVGGILFFRKYKGGWVQLVVGVVLMFAVTMALFQISQTIFLWNQQQLTAPRPAVHHAVPAEESSIKAVTLSAVPMSAQVPATAKNVSDPAPAIANPGTSPQHTLAKDIATLNSRTRIWASTIQHIRKNPSILIWGTHASGVKLAEKVVQHAHNSWLEVLLRAGLPGLVLCLIFTFQTIISSLVVLFSDRADSWKKTISLLMLSILITSIFEPSLFFTLLQWNFVDFFFFLCLGYLLQWAEELRSHRPRGFRHVRCV